MKVKIKYSGTKKFVLNFDGNNLGELVEAVRKFIANTYGDNCPNLALSLNGQDALEGLDVPIRELGVVAMDLLTVVNARRWASGSSSSASGGGSGTAASGFAAAGGISVSTSGSGTGGTKDATKAPPPPTTLLEVVQRRSSGSSESRLPQTLVRLVQQCRPSGAGQLVNLLAHITMLECGWRTAGQKDDATGGVKGGDGPPPTPPPGWDSLVSSIPYTHASYADFSCTLVLVSMGPLKQILVSFPSQDVEISTKVNVGDYYVEKTPESVSGERGNSADDSSVRLDDIRNVLKIAQTLRNELLVPLQLAAHRILDLPSPFHLAGLPHEVLLIILRKLDVKSTLRLSLCCRRLRDAIQDNSLWLFYYKRDFDDPKYNLDNMHWSVLYRERHINRPRSSEHPWNNPPPFYQPPDVPWNNPYPLAPPGARIFPTGPGYPDPVGPYPNVPDPALPFNPFLDPDSPHYGGGIPDGRPNPHHPLGPLHGGDPLNPFGDPTFGGLGPTLPGRPRDPRRPMGGPGGGAGGFRFI